MTSKSRVNPSLESIDITGNLYQLCEVNKALAQKSLYEFAKQAWPIIEPSPYIDGKHIEVICNALQESYQTKGLTSLLIGQPPRTGKSTIVSVIYPAWLFIQNPSIRILSASYSLGLAIRDAVKSRRIIESKWYQDNWGDRVKLADDQNAKARYETTVGGHRLVCSPESSTTGEGGDVIIVDDIHNVIDCYSDAAIKTAVLWYNEVLSTRINNPQQGQRVIVGQRISEADLYGHLVASGIDHLCLPASYDANHPYTSSRDWRSEDGELLWPERLDQAALDQFQVTLGRVAYNAQFQQLPSPAEGSIIKADWLSFYDTLPGKLEYCQSWDLAFGGKDTSDYVVGQIWARSGADFYLVDMIRERLDFPATIAAIRKLTNQYPKAVLKLIEAKANGQAVIDSLKHEIPGIVGVCPKDNKVARLSAISPLFEAGNIHLPRSAKWIDTYVHELLAFPNAKNDDMVDVTTQAIQHWSRRKSKLITI